MSDEHLDEEQYEDDSAPGWDAIDEAMKGIYGDQKPQHFAPVIPAMLGGDDPLNGVSVYEVTTEAGTHWHFVTYGFSELFQKEFEDPEISGYGFELTFRLVKEAGEEEVPAWAVNLLQNMARYVYRTGNVFHSGDYLDANGPICLESETKLTSLAFIEDAALPPRDTPNGKLQFLQMIGITAGEHEAMQLWDTKSVLEVLEAHMPHFVTNLERECLTLIPQVALALRAGTEQHGSSTGFLFVHQLDFEPPVKKLLGKKQGVLQIGAKQAEMVGRLLQGRLLKGRDLHLIGPHTSLQLRLGSEASIVSAEDNEDEVSVVMELDKATLESLIGYLHPVVSTFTLPSLPDLLIRIILTEIRDQEGNVVQTIG